MSLDISGTTGLNSSAFTQYASDKLSQASSNSTEQAANKLKKAASGIGSDTDDDELMSACKEFESYFLEQIFKEMDKSVEAFKDDSSTDQSTDTLVSYYKDQTIADIASTSTETQGTGLAQMLYENMKRNYDV